MKEDELHEHNITGLRMMTASVLGSKPLDIFMIVLIIIYTIMVLIFLALDDSFYDNNPKLELSFQIIELFILFIFCVDIGARIYAFRMLFLKDRFNIIDIIIIGVAIIFTILDMVIDNNTASAIFRIRGVFRLLRVALLIRKLDELKQTRKAKAQGEIDYADFKSPLERTLEILTNLKECLEDQKYIRDLNY